MVFVSSGGEIMMDFLMCGYQGCHVIDVPATRECDCTKCPSSITICDDYCMSFMAKVRRSIFFSEAAIKKCKMCLEATKNGMG
jgi:hypothetical protein